MTKVLENIVEYYIEEVMERENVNRNVATKALEEVLQDYDMQYNIIAETIKSIN